MFLFIFLVFVGNARLLNILDYGAIAETPTALAVNSLAISKALNSAEPGDTIFIPNSTFHCTGGIDVKDLHGVTIRFDGTLNMNSNRDVWPLEKKKKKFQNIFSIKNSTNIILTSTGGTGLIDGNGKPWWNGEIENTLGAHRPWMLYFKNVTGLLIEKLHLLNSPKYHIYTDDCHDVEIRFVEIFVDRKIQRSLRSHVLWELNGTESYEDRLLQPEDLNTDGIDVRGTNFHIHHVRIENDDDSIAVKDSAIIRGKSLERPCTQGILIEDSTLIGFGASIGSVPPSEYRNCVKNVTWRNINMPKTGKGIYIKSNPSCSASNKTGLIADILYENITITQPRWWAIWIGPQQQHEPHDSGADDGKCSLMYPMHGECPTQGCVTFANITLRDVYIEDPYLSPGLVLGNDTNPMQNVVFDNVHVKKGPFPDSIFPFKFDFHCEHAEMTVKNSHPEPNCG